MQAQSCTTRIHAYKHIDAPAPPTIFLPIALKFSQQHADTVVGTYKEQSELLVAKRKCHCLQHSIATHLRDAGAVMVTASGDAAYPITACAMGMVSDFKSHKRPQPHGPGEDHG
jgi:hypothetical protein